MSNGMARQNFLENQSEIVLGAPATTDEFEITEGRWAKIERPLQPINLKSPKVEGRNYATPDPQAFPPSGNDFEQRFKEKRKGNEQRNGPARFSENSIRN